MRKLSAFSFVALALLTFVIGGNAYAAVDLTGVTFDLTTVEAVVALALVGLTAMWGIRKVIKTVNRS